MVFRFVFDYIDAHMTSFYCRIQPVMMNVHFPPFLCSFLSFYSRWEDDWWCFSENYSSLTSLQLSALPLQHTEPLLLAIRRLDRLHTAHNGLCTVEVSRVSLPLAPSLLLSLFRRWVTMELRGSGVVLMSFWSTFQEATYYSAYECVEFISTHSSVCANSSSSVVLPLEFEKGVSNTLYWTHWILQTTDGRSRWLFFILWTTLKQCVKRPSPEGS